MVTLVKIFTQLSTGSCLNIHLFFNDRQNFTRDFKDKNQTSQIRHLKFLNSIQHQYCRPMCIYSIQKKILRNVMGFILSEVYSIHFLFRRVWIYNVFDNQMVSSGKMVPQAKSYLMASLRVSFCLQYGYMCSINIWNKWGCSSQDFEQGAISLFLYEGVALLKSVLGWMSYSKLKLNPDEADVFVEWEEECHTWKFGSDFGSSMIDYPEIAERSFFISFS